MIQQVNSQFTRNLKANQIHTLSFIAKWMAKKTQPNQTKIYSLCPKRDFAFGMCVGF